MNSLSVNFKVGGPLAISADFASAVGFNGGTFQVNYEGNSQPSTRFLFQSLNCNQGLTPDAYKGLRFVGSSELTSSNPTEVLVGLDLSPLTNCWRLSSFSDTLNFQIPSGTQNANGVALVGFPTFPGGGSYLDVIGDFWSGFVNYPTQGNYSMVFTFTPVGTIINNYSKLVMIRSKNLSFIDNGWNKSQVIDVSVPLSYPNVFRGAVTLREAISIIRGSLNSFPSSYPNWRELTTDLLFPFQQ